MENEDVIDAYRIRLGEKAHLLDRFAKATVKIRDGIASGAIKVVAQNLTMRQAIIERIESIDREVGTLRMTDGFSSKTENESIIRHEEQIRTCLAKLLDVDRDCLALAQAQYDSMRSDILGIRSGLQAAKGYGRTRNNTPRFLDLKR